MLVLTLYLFIHHSVIFYLNSKFNLTYNQFFCVFGYFFTLLQCIVRVMDLLVYLTILKEMLERLKETEGKRKQHPLFLPFCLSLSRAGKSVVMFS